MLMLLALLSCAGKAGAQTVAVKSDLLTGSMLASPNLGVELKLSERFTLEAGFHYNPFPAGGDRRWKHWFVQPELRYWMCQPYGGHFFGANLMYGVYNVAKARLPFGLFKGIRSERYERRVQRSQGKAAFRAFQRDTFRKIRGRLYGSGNIIRLSLHPLPPLGTGNKHRRRVSAYRIRTLPLLALRGEDRERQQEFSCPDQGGNIHSVHDKIATRIITIAN